MPNLFPSGYESETLSPEEVGAPESASGYAPGVYFDGDLRRDGKFRLVEATGVESWEQWCKKCLLTERYSSPCYSTDYGIEIQEAMAAGSRELAESILTRQISEALMADPRGRTQYVSGVDFTWLDDGRVEIAVSATGIDNATADFTVITGGDNSGIYRTGISQ